MSRPDDKRPTETIRGDQVLKVTVDDDMRTLTFEMPDRRVVLDEQAIAKSSDGVIEYIRETHGREAAAVVDHLSNAVAAHVVGLRRRSKGN